ncbi:MAG TPA: DUF3048 domain-containing protein, partial [Caldilineae bacterium]|nr:DUF3048 domain-containing protein [Caldilineae bacterium]
ATPTPEVSFVDPKAVEGVSFLTGLTPEDPTVLQRRPLAIKVANQASAIPQTGLNKADIVVESRVEFNQTRYTAIYQSQDASRVGSIRSARLIDVELPDIFDAVLAFSGAVEPVRQKLYRTPDLENQILEAVLNPKAFHRDGNLKPPDNLFLDTKVTWEHITRKGWNTPPNAPGGWVFADHPPEGGASASAVDIPYPAFPVTWTYDADNGTWRRFLKDKPHVDKETGEQLTSDNIVLIYAQHSTTLIVEHGNERRYSNGVCINCSIEIQIWGSGPLKVLRDGRVYEGVWTREGRGAPLTFTFNDGSPLPLKPGNSWWQVVRLDMPVTITP